MDTAATPLELNTLPEFLQIPRKLYPVLTRFNDYEAILLDGGRGSGKSHSIARLLLYLGEKRCLRIVCGRETEVDIEASVYTLLKDLINKYDLAYDVMAYKIKHKWSGTEFSFKGFRDSKTGNVNIKGLEAVDILWLDEAQSITKATLDVIVPTIIRRSKARLIYTMNRFLRDDAVFMKYANSTRCLSIHIDYFENPFCPLSMKIEAEECKIKHPRDYEHIWLGHPLAQADNHLFDFDKLHAAFDVTPFGDITFRQRILGVDFAAQGNDQCVATVFDRVSPQHWKIAERLAWDESDTTVSTGKIIDFVGRFKPTISIIDIGGMGKPVFDRLNEVLGRTNQKFFPFDGGSTNMVDTNHYLNARSQGYHVLKEWFGNGFIFMEDKDREVIRQAEHIKMKYSSNGVRSIQSKVDMKKELKYSPDDLDSLMMAVWAATHYLGKEANSIAENDAVITRKNVSRRERVDRR